MWFWYWLTPARCISSSMSAATCLPGVVLDIWVCKGGGEGPGSGSGWEYALAWRSWGIQGTPTTCFTVYHSSLGKEGARTDRWLPNRRPGLEVKILVPTLPLCSLCHWLPWLLAHVHGQQTYCEHLFSQNSALGTCIVPKVAKAWSRRQGLYFSEINRNSNIYPSNKRNYKRV